MIEMIAERKELMSPPFASSTPPLMDKHSKISKALKT
jgi:hypothetical protein